MCPPSSFGPTPLNTMHDFRAAMAAIPLETKWVHHGRDIVTDGGLDCIGYVLAMFRGAGLSLDDLDRPYGVRDTERPKHTAILTSQIARRFKRQSGPVPRDCRDGDVLLIGPMKDNHLAIVVNGCAVEMTGKRLGGRNLRIHRLTAAWPFVTAAFRHNSL